MRGSAALAAAGGQSGGATEAGIPEILEHGSLTTE